MAFSLSVCPLTSSYAGIILTQAAQYIEDEPDDFNNEEINTTVGWDGFVCVSKARKAFSSIASLEIAKTLTMESNTSCEMTDMLLTDDANKTGTLPTKDPDNNNGSQQHSPHHDSSTFNYIGLI